MDRQIRLRTGIVIWKDGQILLVPHFLEEQKIRWYLPGGEIEFGETIAAATTRELEEETGIIGSILNFIDTIEVIEEAWHSITLCYRGVYIGGKIKREIHPKYGIKEAKWFSKIELSNVDYHPKRIIDEAFKTLL